MTPEQEDAHWALMGKPLMRAWRERCRLRAEADAKLAEAYQQFNDGNRELYGYLIDEGNTLRRRAAILWQDAMIAAYGDGVAASWNFGCCTVDGATYTAALGAATPDAEDL